MKFSLLIMLMLAFCTQLQAQTDQQIRDKTKGYIENRSQKVTIRPIPIPMPFGSFTLTEKHLVVIDGKIFKGTDPALKQLSPDALLFVSAVKDETSGSGIEQILFYKTKAK